MKLVRLLLRNSRPAFVAALLASVISGLTSTLLIGQISRALTSVDLFSPAFFARFLGLIVIVVGADLFSKLVLNRLTENAYRDLQVTLVRRILATPIRRLEALGAPRLLAALTSDVAGVTYLLQRIPAVMFHVAVVTSATVYLFWVSSLTASLLLIVMALGFAGYSLLNGRARRHLVAARRLSDTVFGHYEAVIEGSKELKLHRQRRHSFFERLFLPSTQAFMSERLTGRNQHEIANTWTNVMYFVFVLALFVLVGRAGSVDPLILTSFTLVTLYLRSSVAHITNTIPNYVHASVSLAAIEALELDDDPPDLAPPASDNPHWTAIGLRQASFAYKDEEYQRSFMLGPLDLTFHTGEIVFVIGGNGSGKTTLVKLLTGLYTPESGDILWNGAPVRDEGLEAYRQGFSAVFGDFFLFEDMLGLETPEHELYAQYYLQSLKLDHKVTITDGRISTTRLSHGQRKRLALLTAYLEDRPIYVFDEWAAGQDPQFTELFYTVMLPELKQRGKLVLVVTHDDHFFASADRLIKLEYGQIEMDTGDSSSPQETVTQDTLPQSLAALRRNGDGGPL